MTEPEMKHCWRPVVWEVELLTTLCYVVEPVRDEFEDDLREAYKRVSA